jgi:hypothetical protein
MSGIKFFTNTTQEINLGFLLGERPIAGRMAVRFNLPKMS